MSDIFVKVQYQVHVHCTQENTCHTGQHCTWQSASLALGQTEGKHSGSCHLTPALWTLPQLMTGNGCISQGTIHPPHPSTGPVYNKNCRNSVAFHLSRSCKPQGCRANSFGIFPLRAFSFWDISPFCLTDKRQWFGPLVKNNMRRLTTPKMTICM